MLSSRVFECFSLFYDLCILYLMYACNLVIDVKLIVRWKRAKGRGSVSLPTPL